MGEEYRKSEYRIDLNTGHFGVWYSNGLVLKWLGYSYSNCLVHLKTGKSLLFKWSVFKCQNGKLTIQNGNHFVSFLMIRMFGFQIAFENQAFLTPVQISTISKLVISNLLSEFQTITCSNFECVKNQNGVWNVWKLDVNWKCLLVGTKYLFC